MEIAVNLENLNISVGLGKNIILGQNFAITQYSEYDLSNGKCVCVGGDFFVPRIFHGFEILLLLFGVLCS